MVGDAHAATAGTAIDVKRRSEHMENEDSLKIERLEDDGLQDVSAGPALCLPLPMPQNGEAAIKLRSVLRKGLHDVPILEQVIPGIRVGVPLLIR